MKLSSLLFQSLRNVPNEADSVSHQLLLRASYIRQVAAGIFDYLPLGFRALQRLEHIIRSEMDALGAQELRLPVVQPAELWQSSGRWDSVGPDLVRFQDRAGRDFCLAMTHEEVAAALVAGIVQSYRQLPLVVYQIQTKFRDEPRPRSGLIRTREFTMKDAYSFHTDEASFEATYQKVYDAYFRIFERCGLDVIAVDSDTGMMGGKAAHEFMFLTPMGEDTLLLCDGCGYKANRQVATFQKPKAAFEEMGELEQVATPDVTTIDVLADFLSISKAKTAKAVFYMAELDAGEESFVFAVLRGDMEVNETKLSAQIKAKTLRPATIEEIHTIGAEPGYGSPIGIKREGVVLIVDDAVTTSANLVAGANRVGYHLLNTNYERDYKADIAADIAAAADGDACPHCADAMRAERGVEVGNIFKFGTLYSEAFGANFRDKLGEQKPLVTGSYGIGIGRLMACLVEQYHDEGGICWPKQVAPYDLALVALTNKDSPEVARQAEVLYKELMGAGFSVLFDERNESPGVKFNDADLIGLPIRVTVGKRGLERGIVEVKRREAKERQEVALDHLLETLQTL